MTHLVKEFCIEIENTPGAIANVCTALGTAGINLQSIASEHIGGQGFLRIIPEDSKATEEMLNRKDFMYSENTVIVKAFEDKPNQIADAVEKLGAEGININALYLLQSKNGKAQVGIVTDDPQKASRLLRA